MQIAIASISLTLMVHFRKGLHLQADTTQSTSNMLDKLTGNAHLASPLKETVSLPTHQQSHNWFIPVQKYQVTSTFKSVRMYVRFPALFRRHVKLLHQSLSRLTSPRSSIETACFLIQAISWSETSREIGRYRAGSHKWTPTIEDLFPLSFSSQYDQENTIHSLR